jgi:hypothetical protein
MPDGPVSTWSTEDKIAETIRRSKPYLGPVLGQQVDVLLSPLNLSIMAGTLAIWAGSHFFGVGEIVDVALLLVGAFMLGPAIVDVAEKLIEFGKCINAQTSEELDVCAKAFAEAAVKGGITVIMAILLRRGAKGLEAARAPGVTNPSWLEVATPKRPFGLPKVGLDPQPGTWWSRIPAVADASLPAGEGSTSAFGEITYSAQGPASEQELVLLHETVHRFFSPRLGILRTFRARLNIAAYSQSAILQYLEEAMAETYAQLRVNGFRGILTGIRFPVANNYVTISELAAEGQAIGTIVVGSQRFTVSIQVSPPSVHPPPLRSAAPTTSRGGPSPVVGGFFVKVPLGSSLSAIAKSQYGDYELWPLIYDLNRQAIGPNPNLVKAGAHLRLLPLNRYSLSEIADARKRAPSWKTYH